MTNNELLHSDMLDILFEHRNKSYGAYALRRSYDRRLLTALGIGLSLISAIILFDILGNEDATSNNEKKRNTPDVIITQIELPKTDPPPPPKPLPPPQTPATLHSRFASVKFTIPVIKPDEVVPLTEIPDKGELNDKEIGNDNKDGLRNNNVVTVTGPSKNGNGKEGTEEKPLPVYIPDERGPEFPGGMGALHQFLSRHIDNPDDLNAGDKKTVRVRFWIGKDGSVSAIEIEQSAGDLFDKEVIRVCKKMPRWKPAIQNGVAVPVSYLLPVTFISLEQ